LRGALASGTPVPQPRRPELAAATARLEALPVPEGRHPFVEDIAPALEGMQAALAALAASPTTASKFSAARLR